MFGKKKSLVVNEIIEEEQLGLINEEDIAKAIDEHVADCLKTDETIATVDDYYSEEVLEN